MVSTKITEYKLGAHLGQGGYSHVYKATEISNANIVVALKKSRVSRKIKRTLFDTRAIVDQALSGTGTCSLEGNAYIATSSLTTILCALDDDSIIKLVDFGLSKPLAHRPPSQYNPYQERRYIAGSLYWASLNSHNGLDLTPRDDLESLAIPTPLAQEIVRIMKSKCTGERLAEGFPHEFGELLTYSRSLEFTQLPDYTKLRREFAELATNEEGGSLDTSEGSFWTASAPSPISSGAAGPEVDEIDIDLPPENEVEVEYDMDIGSYLGYDIELWDNRQGERDKDLTLSAEQAEALDGCLLLIEQVVD
ncbi:hypothetical protein BT96DRAFT_1089241 [Gymnopus androsaceus JB14]|uniref:Protein kinase domain-containing protein n=1 Tax=Gymnopus androsaceus JB14 TaxID=1447944 RepID=A0A6A4HZF0_9AGAR|nr:hypothetical protein BT96DRAFT_1089241 [Gymnopus androsaceus JB14]